MLRTTVFLHDSITKAKPEYTVQKKSIISFIVRWCNYYNEIDIVKLRQLSRMTNYLPLSAHADFGSISSSNSTESESHITTWFSCPNFHYVLLYGYVCIGILNTAGTAGTGERNCVLRTSPLGAVGKVLIQLRCSSVTMCVCVCVCVCVSASASASACVSLYPHCCAFIQGQQAVPPRRAYGINLEVCSKSSVCVLLCVDKYLD